MFCKLNVYAYQLQIYQIRTCIKHCRQTRFKSFLPLVTSRLLERRNDGILSYSYHTNETNRKHHLHHSKKINSQYFRASQLSTVNKTDTENEWHLPDGLNTGIMLYNSLTRRKEPLVLPNGRLISWYACGPTVYDHAHIGHASSYVRLDIIRRILMKQFNIDVVMVMGITDIDDKIILRSKQLGMDFRQLGKNFEKSFFKDLEILGVLPPTIKTRVTEHIPEIIEFINKIMQNGLAYQTQSGSVYFDVQKYGRYGRLWKNDMDTEVREPADNEKLHHQDFALWKSAKPGEPYWESPFGEGRPGWHIECSTMASAVFGNNLDIHSGGEDLCFPHHENEMAQSEACFCTNQWTNYWVHTGHLHLSTQQNKMSKSLDNGIHISKLLASYSPNQFRIFCMQRPYRNVIEYSDEAMVKAVQVHKNWTSFIHTADAYISGQLESKPVNEEFLLLSLQQTKTKVENALADDFDTPRAILAMEELIKRANKELARPPMKEADFGSRSIGVVAAVARYLESFMDMCGLKVMKRKTWTSISHDKFNNVVDSVIEFRSNVREFVIQPPVRTEENKHLSDKQLKKEQGKKYQVLMNACDRLREDLNVNGIIVSDHGGKSTWDIAEDTIEEEDTDSDSEQSRHNGQSTETESSYVTNAQSNSKVPLKGTKH